MAINRPDSFNSVGKAKLPDSGQDFGTIVKIEGEDNVVITPSSGQGNVTVALSLDTARTTWDGFKPEGYYHPGCQVLYNMTTTASLTAGKFYYWSATGTWGVAESSTDGNALIAMCSDVTDGSEMVFKGLARCNQTFSGSANGLRLYLNSSGNLTVTPSTTANEWVRIIGYVKDGASGLIYIDVSNDFYQNPA